MEERIWSLLWIFLACCGNVSVKKPKSKFTVEELLNTRFPYAISSDIDADPCKSAGFYGDVALPNIKYELELEIQKANQSNKDEYLEILEGLQVEEEGLPELHKAKQKHDAKIRKEEQRHRRRHQNGRDVGRLAEDGVRFNASRKNRRRTKQRTKYPDLEEEFDQVEPKYFPRSEEFDPEYYEPDRNRRIQNERRRRIQHAGDATAAENAERERMRNGSVVGDMIKDDVTVPGRSVGKKRLSNRCRKVLGGCSSQGSKPKQSWRKCRRKLLKRGRKFQTVTSGEDRQTGSGRRRGWRKPLRRNNRRRPDEPAAREDVSSERQESINSTGKLRMIAEYQNIPTAFDLGSKPQRRVVRAATARKERVWDYGVIPYEIDGNFSGMHKALFKQAMRHWENFTCIRFVERSVEDHPNYIIFTEKPCGCCSFVGKRGNGPQAISIGKNCDKFGIVVHELGHVVGFWHEHTRPDRDNHVQIIRENIMSGQEYNFNKLNEDEVNSLGLPYDYDSIMHYAKNTFSRGTYLDTITPLDKPGVSKKPEIGQRIRLSEGDIAQTNLVYKCFKCGRTFQETSGNFSSPNYGNLTQGSSGHKCEWRITATHGQKIFLNITDLDIHESEGCWTDYLEIRDGYWHKSQSLGRLCGKLKTPTVVISTGARMLITYITTQNSEGRKGFLASYEAICGGEVYLSDKVGHLESPNFPEDYQPNIKCVWKLSVPENFQVALKFQYFQVENHDNCVYDYVELRDGHDPDSPIIGTYCGNKTPPNVRSSSNKLMVTFVSDATVQKEGFAANFLLEFDECKTISHGCEHECINTLGTYECACKIGYELHSDGKHCEDACGGILESPNGTITSPSFPKPYPSNKKCIWEIIAPPQYKITLNFTHFDLEGNSVYHQECEYDKVEVHSKMPENHLRRHGVYCGLRKQPMIITSEKNSLRVEFTSDGTVQKSGFAAVFFTGMRRHSPMGSRELF
ncbi:UNVERIFIED_CONTAM: hypothetical protein PYX00_002062 [Menopon gallinae]|uniref:Metalloendopeptidase n=1 Tax=Menopon gallinae TaxID=328185 RepID=A0AAW2IFU6_9NEOP